MATQKCNCCTQVTINCTQVLDCVYADLSKVAAGNNPELSNFCSTVAKCVDDEFYALAAGLPTAFNYFKPAIFKVLKSVPGYQSTDEIFLSFNEDVLQWTTISEGGGGTDELVKVSSNDLIPGYLLDKLIQGSGILLTENNDGANESITIAHSDTSSVSNLNTSTSQVIDTMTFDTFGHVQTVTTRDLTLADLGYTPPIGTGRFGVEGEDELATENRSFDLNGGNRYFEIKDINYNNFWGIYDQLGGNSLALSYLFQSSSTDRQVGNDINPGYNSLYVFGNGAGANAGAVANMTANNQAEYDLYITTSDIGIQTQGRLHIFSNIASDSYVQLSREQLVGTGNNGRLKIDNTGLMIQAKTTIGGTYKGLLVKPDTDIRLENYLSTRNDGATSSALYVDISGNVKYGPVTSASSLRFGYPAEDVLSTGDRFFNIGSDNFFIGVSATAPQRGVLIQDGFFGATWNDGAGLITDIENNDGLNYIAAQDTGVSKMEIQQYYDFMDIKGTLTSDKRMAIEMHPYANNTLAKLDITHNNGNAGNTFGTQVLLRPTFLALQASATPNTSASFKGIQVALSGDLKFDNYPNSRSDGVTTKALYISSISGDVVYGDIVSAGGATLADGDYGDITASSSGTVLTIDNDVVTDAKLRDSAALSIIGRSANSVGNPADIVAGSNEDVLMRNGYELQWTYPNLIKREGNVVGTIFEKATLSDTTDLTISIAAPGTATVIGDTLFIDAENSGYGNYIIVDSFKTSLDVSQVEASIIVDDIFALGNGIYLGIWNPNAGRFSTVLWFDLQLGGNLGGLHIKGSSSALPLTLATATGNVPVSIGDTIDLKYSIYESTVTAWARNVTQDSAWYSVSYTYTGLDTKMSAGYVYLGITPSRFYLLNLKYSSQQIKNPDVYLLGDSKFTKSTFQNKSYASLLKNNYGVIVANAGCGDALSDLIDSEYEIINFVQPKKILIENSNSIRYGVSSGTWQAEVDQLYNDFTAAGIEVYFTSFYETGASQAAMDTYLTATYPTRYIQAAYAVTENCSDCLADGVHLNDLGNLRAFEATILDGKISSTSTPQTGIQFKDEGSSLGSIGTVDVVDFVGAGVAATRAGNTVTVTIGSGGGGGTPGGSTKQVQYNNAGSFGGYTGFEVGNTNNDVLIKAGVSTSVALNVKAASSQSANLLNLSSSSGTADFGKVTASGNLVMGSNAEISNFDLQFTKGIAARDVAANQIIQEYNTGSGLNNGSLLIQRAASGNTWDIYTYNGSGISLSETGAQLAFSSGASGKMVLKSDGKFLVGENNPAYASNTLSVLTADTNTNSVIYNFDLFHRLSSGSHAVGMGVGMNYVVETQAFVNTIGAQTATVATDITGASEDFDWIVKTIAAGSVAEKLRVLSTGELKVQLINNDNTETKLVTWNSTDKIFEYRTVASLPAGSGKIYATLTIGASDALDPTASSYDYSCDGTADEVQILAAIAALPATGGRIILSEGTFNIAAAIVIDNDNVVLEGQGQGTKIFLVNATNTNMITVGSGATAYTNITIKNLYMDGNKANQTTNGHGIRVEPGAINTIIENCRIFSTFKDNINGGTAVVGAKIIYNYLDTTGASSYNIHWAGTKCICSNNYCTGGTTGNINFDGSVKPSGNIISNNTCTASSGVGISVASWQVVVSGNHVSDFAFEGITSTVPANITGNSVYQNGGVGNIGIYLSSSDPQQCTANTIFVYSTVNFVFTGIYCQTASATITGNNIQYESSTSPAHIGILIGADKVACTGNAITQYQFTGTGIVRFGTASWNTISGNMITGFDKGIDITSMKYATCNGNSIDCNDGIIATDSVNCVISDNTIYGNTVTGTQKGIYVNNSSALTITITGNSIYRTAVEGIYLAKITKSIISNNKIYNGSTQTSSAGILLTGTSTYNTITGNTVHASGNVYTYAIQEASSADGPNIITGNICLNWTTAAIGNLHASTQIGLNITS